VLFKEFGKALQYRLHPLELVRIAEVRDR